MTHSRSSGRRDSAYTAGLVMGVTTTPVTSPLIASFCFRLVVPLALRVALSFVAATAFCSTVLGARTLGA